jgi:hypothetical protein
MYVNDWIGWIGEQGGQIATGEQKKSTPGNAQHCDVGRAP